MRDATNPLGADEAVRHAVASARLDGHELSDEWIERLRLAARTGTEPQLLAETLNDLHGS